MPKEEGGCLGKRGCESVLVWAALNAHGNKQEASF